MHIMRFSQLSVVSGQLLVDRWYIVKTEN